MPEDLGAQVRSELFKRKMSQKELAEMVGISNAYLSDIDEVKQMRERNELNLQTIKIYSVPLGGSN
ncbi:helix-turn-helix domain-containing protein [Lysinibacillus xylanilyticus]|uniref:helix-turn-helix domain-containing protein n=1 Tax=Lysinibacillus xylanilyticus TaxID=582475 RepID=UPI00380D8B11